MVAAIQPARRSGLIALAVAAVLTLGAGSVGAQVPSRPAPAPAPSAALRPAPAAPGATPIPDRLGQLRLVWSTMAAVDHANRSGNYSVLRDLGSPGFQANNNAATLAGIFATLRSQEVDLSETLIVQPNFEIARMNAPDVLRLRGSFPLRPAPVLFDLLFQWQDGGWRLHGIAVVRGQAMSGR